MNFGGWAGEKKQFGWKNDIWFCIRKEKGRQGGTKTGKMHVCHACIPCCCNFIYTHTPEQISSLCFCGCLGGCLFVVCCFAFVPFCFCCFAFVCLPLCCLVWWLWLAWDWETLWTTAGRPAVSVGRQDSIHISFCPHSLSPLFAHPLFLSSRISSLPCVRLFAFLPLPFYFPFSCTSFVLAAPFFVRFLPLHLFYLCTHFTAPFCTFLRFLLLRAVL